MLNILTWTASIITLLAMLLISSRENIGFLVAIAGSAIWVVVGINSGLTGLTVLNAVFIVIDAYGYGKGFKHANKGLKIDIRKKLTL